MSLIELLRKHRSAIVKQWVDRVIATYPPDTALFLRSQTDGFANPVGQTTISSLEGLYDALLEDPQPESAKLSALIDPVLRIRAVQSFTPSQAVGFILELKPLVLERLGRRRRDAVSPAQWQRFAARIDRLALLAFDIYVACREQIFNLKVSTERDKTYRAFARAGLIVEEPEPSPERDAASS